jgi:glycosyltransferase involved in cell wall biosynthesis
MPLRPANPSRLMMTSFGFNDSGGGTTVPRLAAKELARRGWDVTVFHAAVQPTESRSPYEVREWEEDGVRLIGVHNRPQVLFDLGHPLRELDDPPITAAFVAALERLDPDVVHFHNLHNLGAALIDQASARGLPAFFTTHNYWLICPRAYLLTGSLSICPGPGDGSRCAACVNTTDVSAHRRRLGEIRARAHNGLTRILAVSEAVRQTLLAAGYSPELVDVVRQAMPHEAAIWDAVGRDRSPGRLRERLTVAFLGSAYPHKGPQLLVEAAQRTAATIDVRIIGEIAPKFEQHLRSLDGRGVVSLQGAFSPGQIGELLSDVDVAVLPSMWWDCAPLAAAECLAARVPLVVPRLGGLPEAITEGVNGLLVDALDPGDLARVLDRVDSEPGLLDHLQSGISQPPAFADYVDELEAYYSDPGHSARDAADMSARVAVRWKGDHGLPTSLSIINTTVSDRLGPPLQRVRADGGAIDPPLPHPATVEIRQQWPPDLDPPASGRLAAIVPWEFGSVPREWLGSIAANVDELWVPSEYVREMYLDGGADPTRVHVIANGVDLDLFSPEPEARQHDEKITRFLFVGGLIWRKGPEILLDAFKQAFADRDDVELVVKDFGADSVYRDGLRDPFIEYVASGTLPRMSLISESVSVQEMVELYRSCDVLVHPYRGEGFGMPPLEAMACGLPVIVTAGGPTDEFCPPEAGWRIRSTRREMASVLLEPFVPAGTAFTLEPDQAHLVELLKTAQAQPAERLARGRAGRAAAEALSWDTISARYRERIAAVARLPPKLAWGDDTPFPLTEGAQVRVLATPAWAGADQLADLLRDWGELTTSDSSACLYLLADPAVAGEIDAIETHIVQAAERGGVDLDACADVNVLIEPLQAHRDIRLHAAVTAYVPLHQACAGHARYASAAGNAVLAPGSQGLRELLANAG